MQLFKPSGSGFGGDSLSNFAIDVAHRYAFGPVGVLAQGGEVIPRDASATHQCKPDAAIEDWRRVLDHAATAAQGRSPSLVVVVGGKTVPLDQLIALRRLQVLAHHLSH